MTTASRIALLALILISIASTSAFAGSSRDLVLTASTSPVPGERRLALVIGNASYSGDGIHQLKNPVNDATAMGSTLKGLGFSVRELIDADRDGIRDAVHDFAQDIRKSPQDVVALLYYSGHGMQVAGQNYLVPIGFQMPRDAADVGDYAYAVQKALGEMESANARVNIVILDACRSNPFDTSRAVGGAGLVKMEASGVYIAYATAEGKTADDNDSSDNGLYTANLLKVLRTPGLDIHQVFQAARRSVWTASNHEQYPYDYDGLLDDDFYFNGRPSTAPVVQVNDSSHADAVAKNATDLYLKGKYTDAETLFRQAIRMDPKNPDYQDGLALDLLTQNKYVEAEHAERTAIGIEPNNAAYQDDLALVFSLQQKYREAEPFNREAVRLNPKNASYQNGLGGTLMAQKRFVDAEPYFREAVRLDPTHASYQDDLGFALDLQGRSAEAETYRREAVRLMPTSPDYQSALGNDLFEEGKYADAEICHREAARLDPTSAVYQHHIGEDLYAQRRYSAAEPFYRQATTLAPSNGSYKDDLDKCVKAEGS